MKGSNMRIVTRTIFVLPPAIVVLMCISLTQNEMKYYFELELEYQHI